MKVLLKRFHLNGNTIGFRPQTQKLELRIISLLLGQEVEELNQTQAWWEWWPKDKGLISNKFSSEELGEQYGDDFQLVRLGRVEIGGSWIWNGKRFKALLCYCKKANNLSTVSPYSCSLCTIFLSVFLNILIIVIKINRKRNEFSMIRIVHSLNKLSKWALPPK